jgi:hypothetical protein
VERGAVRARSKNSLHERIIDAVVSEHGAKRRGFATEIRRSLGATSENVDTEHIFEYFREWRYTPDAFRIDVVDDRPVVTVWEVEVSHKLSAEKLYGYVDLLWFLDSEEAAFRLISVSHYGAQCEIDLLTWSSGGPMSTELSERLGFCHAPDMGFPKVTPAFTPSWLEDE